MKKYIIIICVSILFITCKDETSPTENNNVNSNILVEGRVVLKEGYLINAKVELKNADKTFSTFTDTLGAFKFENIPSAEYELWVSKTIEGKPLKVMLKGNIKNSTNLGDLTFNELGYIVGKVDLLETNDDRLAKVLLLGTGINALTDSKGNYKLLYIPPGTYEIQIEKEGFITLDTTGIVVSASSVDTINFELKPIVSKKISLIKSFTVDASTRYISWSGKDLIGTSEDSVFTIDTLTGNRNVFFSRIVDTSWPWHRFGEIKLDQNTNKLILGYDESSIYVNWYFFDANNNSLIDSIDANGTNTFTHVFIINNNKLNIFRPDYNSDQTKVISFDPYTLQNEKTELVLNYKGIWDINHYNNDSFVATVRVNENGQFVTKILIMNKADFKTVQTYTLDAPEINDDIGSFAVINKRLFTLGSNINGDRTIQVLKLD